MVSPSKRTDNSAQRGRFAPSTTGVAHPGTLLAALLCWLDIRSLGGHLCLRFEDLDPDRCRPEYEEGMRADLSWLGLDWDSEIRQSDRSHHYRAALDRLAEQDLLFPCRCSRSELQKLAGRAPDGSPRYPGTCRSRRLPSVAEGGWRACPDPLRLRLPDTRIELVDETGLDLSQSPAAEYGDPLVRRRDGAVAYHLASVVDDQAEGVTRVVRGRDLAPSTAVQVALGESLDGARPAYRHHLLLLENRGHKLAKFHQSVGTDVLRAHYDGPSLCGVLAHACAIRPTPAPVEPHELLADFAWPSVREQDRLLSWSGAELTAVGP